MQFTRIPLSLIADLINKENNTITAETLCINDKIELFSEIPQTYVTFT